MKYKIRFIKIIRFNFDSIKLYKDAEFDFIPQIGLTVSDGDWRGTIKDINYDSQKNTFYAITEIDEQLEDIESSEKTSQKSIDEFIKSAEQIGWKRK